MPLPVAHALVGAGVVALFSRDFSLRRDWASMILGAALAVAPDFDLFFSWVLGYGLKAHGGLTHSIVFALALGSVASLLAREQSVRGVLGYTAATMSHGLLDSITKKDFGGSQLLWPFSTHRYKLGVFSDYEFYPNPGHQPISEILHQAAVISGRELMIYLPPLFLILCVKRLSKTMKSRQPSAFS